MTCKRKDRIWMASMRFCGKYCGCHQMPERSFFIGEYQFPLCARCTGIAAGHVIGAAVSLFFEVPRWAAAAMIPLMIDGSAQELTDYESTNTMRAVTGLLYGFGFMSTLIRCVRLFGSILGRASSHSIT